MLQTFPTASLLNTRTPTHIQRVLDLVFLSTNLLPIATWAIHPFLSSDHFATVITLDTPRLRLPPVIPRWNTKRANWTNFTSFLDEWSVTYNPSEDVDTLEADLVNAIHSAATFSIPVITPIPYKHKKWLHNDRIRELKYRLLQIQRPLSHSSNKS